jgi:hypothetical protein
LRKDKPRSVEALCDSLTYAFYSITPEQVENHFRNAIVKQIDKNLNKWYNKKHELR